MCGSWLFSNPVTYNSQHPARSLQLHQHLFKRVSYSIQSSLNYINAILQPCLCLLCRSHNLMWMLHIWWDLKKAGFNAHKNKMHHTFYHQTIVVHINNNSCLYWCWKLSRLLLLWFVSEACQMSTSTWVVFKRLHLFWTSRQPAVIHHTTGRWILSWI